MRIVSRGFGPVDIEEKQIISFPVGIFGFEELHEYALLDASQSGFYWLQSLENVEIAFLMLNPYDLRQDYELNIPQEDLNAIEYRNDEDLLVFAIVTVPDDETKISANLQGPIVINRVARVGRQSISLDQRWRTKHLILEELAQARS